MPDPLVNRNADRYIPVARPSRSPRESARVMGCLIDNQFSQGPLVAEFESAFASLHGKRHGIACNSGTSAILLALKAIGFKSGDHVICPTLTMIAVPNMILAAGAEPVFVDSKPHDGNIDLSGSLPPLDPFVGLWGMILPHLYGVPIEFPKIQSSFGWIIEDASEAHYGTFSNGDPIGSRGNISAFSFYANKIITTMGEGGIVLTDDDNMADRLRLQRAHAFTEGEHFTHQGHAWGLRMTEPQAAFGLAQHDQRREFIARRAEIAARYRNNLAGIHWLQFQHRPNGSANWVFPLLVQPDQPITRDHVRRVLADAGVETRTWFRPMHQQKHLERFARGQSFPVADDLFARGFYLPLYVDMEDSDVDHVCRALAGIRA